MTSLLTSLHNAQEEELHQFRPSERRDGRSEPARGPGARGQRQCGYGQKLNHLGLAGVSAGSHLSEFHFGYLFFPHSHVATSNALMSAQGGN